MQDGTFRHGHLWRAGREWSLNRLPRRYAAGGEGVERRVLEHAEAGGTSSTRWRRRSRRCRGVCAFLLSRAAVQCVETVVGGVAPERGTVRFGKMATLLLAVFDSPYGVLFSLLPAPVD